MKIEKHSVEWESLNKKLKEASDAYYNGNPIMSDEEYDRLYDSLLKIDSENIGDSQLNKVGAPVKSDKKVTHNPPMLSLEKTKTKDGIIKLFKHDNSLVQTMKLDGIACKLIYVNGKLETISTRGNGKEGEDITHLYKAINNIPLTIDTKLEKVFVIGEILMSYPNFEKYKNSTDIEYKNPRNMVAGLMRNKNVENVVNKGVEFIAYNFLPNEGEVLYENVLNILQYWGFSSIPYTIIFKDEDIDTTKPTTDYPIDGWVFMLNDIKRGKELGVTSHHPRNAIAFKWEDEIELTTLKDIVLQVGKTGQVTPVAIFDAVELEGSTVRKASLHNFDEIKRLKLGVGDTIAVYKANQIIPKVSHSITESDTYIPPKYCPECNSELVKDGVNLYCKNYFCKPQAIGRIVHAFSKNALNVDGLGENTATFLYENGFIKDWLDMYYLTRQEKQQLKETEGFGETSINKILLSLKEAKKLPLHRLLYAFSIPNVGQSASLMLAKKYKTLFNLEEQVVSNNIKPEDLPVGYSDVIIKSLYEFFSSDIYIHSSASMLAELGFNLTEPEDEGSLLKDKIFVMTGETIYFENRNEVKKKIISLGGKFTSSVSKKTSYLICNDTSTMTGKVKRASELGVPIITEKEFCEMIGMKVKRKGFHDF